MKHRIEWRGFVSIKKLLNLTVTSTLLCISLQAYADDPAGDDIPGVDNPPGSSQCFYHDFNRLMTQSEFNTMIQTLNNAGACTEAIGNLTEMFNNNWLRVYTQETYVSQYLGCDEIVFSPGVISGITDLHNAWVPIHEIGHRLQAPYKTYNDGQTLDYIKRQVDANNYANECLEDRNYKYLSGSFYKTGFPSGYENVPAASDGNDANRAIYGTQTVIPTFTLINGVQCIESWLRTTYSNGTVTWDSLGKTCNNPDSDTLL